MKTRETIQELQERLQRENPRLASDTIRSTASRTWRVAWYDAQIERLCELSTDPDRARRLLQWVNSWRDLEARLRQFKGMLVGGGLCTRPNVDAIPSEPTKMHSPVTANKMIVPSESNK